MPYTQLLYHLVWATKNRAPALTPDIEPIIYNQIRAKAFGLGGTVYALNGVEDHVHLVASVPAKLAVATFVGQVKGVSSAKLNQRPDQNRPFYWQDSYGAFTFDKKRLPFVVQYVERQKEHHRANELIPVLERVEEDSGRPIVGEESAAYLVSYDKWFMEMIDLSV